VPAHPLVEGIDKIIKEFALSVSFPKKVSEEARSLEGKISPLEVEHRVDLRQEVVVTIDGETAKDFDDAVSVSSLRSGGFRLKVSIADVSYFVWPGSTIDQEAYKRATSTYFPDRCVPMLPEKLSNDLCSLVPHQDRLTMTAEMDFDAEGKKNSHRFYRSIIRSAARLTYTKVKKILVDEDAELCSSYKLLLPDLKLMAQLAQKLQEVRRKRGSLDFDLPEPSIELDLEERKIERIVKAERNMAHRLIEEFMIAANEAVAEFVTENIQPMIYRIHGEPDPEKVKDFSVLLNNLGYAFRFGKKVDPKIFITIIDAVRGRPEERMVNTLLLRTMSRAIYEAKNQGHFGLASTCYTHFTSPIRRYPDLVVHRILNSLLEREQRKTKVQRNGGSESVLQRIATHCSERERNSMKAEWASRDLAATLFMKTKVGKEYEGIIASVTKFGFFVELIPFFVEGLVSMRNLTDDYYVFHEKAHMIVGRKKKKKFQIGLPVKIRVKGVNFEKRWVDFEVV